MDKLDELWADLRKVQAQFRHNEMLEVVSRFEFKNVGAHRDFLALLRANTRGQGPDVLCPDNLSLKDYAKKEFDARPEWHKIEPPPEPAKTTSPGETVVPSGKEFMIEQIRPEMSDKERAEAWRAIQIASGIEPNTRRFRND